MLTKKIFVLLPLFVFSTLQSLNASPERGDDLPIDCAAAAKAQTEHIEDSNQQAIKDLLAQGCEQGSSPNVINGMHLGNAKITISGESQENACHGLSGEIFCYVQGPAVVSLDLEGEQGQAFSISDGEAMLCYSGSKGIFCVGQQSEGDANTP